MPAEKHVHSYVRVDGTKHKFMCNSPTCSHFVEKRFLVNKLTACPNCDRHFVLTREDLRKQRPLCLYCRDTKEAREFRAKEAAIKNVISQAVKERESPIYGSVDGVDGHIVKDEALEDFVAKFKQLVAKSDNDRSKEVEQVGPIELD